MSEEEKKEKEEETPEDGENQDKKSESEKTEDKSEEIQRRDAQIKHWREKAEKLEEDLKEKGKTDKSTQKKPGEGLEEWKNRVEFRARHNDYTDDEFDHISLVADKKGVSLEEAAESEKEYIDFQRDKVEKEDKTPEPSNKQTPSKKSPKEVTGKELSEMTIEEKKEYFNSIGAGGASTKTKE